MRILALSAILCTLFSACGNKEKIMPFAQEHTIAEGQGIEPGLTVFQGRLNFDQVSITRPVGSIPVPLLGPIFREFANDLANVFVVIATEWDVNQDSVIVPLPRLDLTYVQAIEITKIELTIVPDSVEEPRSPLSWIYRRVTGKRAKLDFIKSLSISLASESMSDRGEKAILANYSSKGDGLGCDKTCLHFNIGKQNDGRRLNLVPLIAEQGHIEIFPKLEVKSTPKSTFKIAGEIHYEIRFRLPF
jgi:hypothetical protein